MPGVSGRSEGGLLWACGGVKALSKGVCCKGAWFSAVKGGCRGTASLIDVAGCGAGLTGVDMMKCFLCPDSARTALVRTCIHG